MRLSVVQGPKPSAYKVQLRRALFSVPRGGRAKASATVRSPSSTPSSAIKICEVRTQERQRLQKVRRVDIPQALLHTDRCLIQENHSDHEFRTIIFFFSPRQGLTGLGLAKLARLVDQQAPKIYMSLPPQYTTTPCILT